MRHNKHIPFESRQHGQAIVEYALLIVLVGLAFGLALAALQGPLQNVWVTARDDVLRQEEVTYVPSRDEFWATVTAEYENKPKRKQTVPTNTPPPPTVEPTQGPPPDPNATPTDTPAPPTPTLTPTPRDRIADAPLYDSIDEPRWWRADYNIALGGTAWTLEFFNNKTVTEPSVYQIGNIMDINYTFQPGTPPALGLSSGENFSIRATRKIRLLQETTLVFNLLTNDGTRIFVNNTEVTLKNAAGTTGAWRDQAETAYVGSVVVPANDAGNPRDTHTIRVEYYNGVGTGRLQLSVAGGSANPDDTAVNAGGDPVAGPFFCNWGRPTGGSAVNNANTESYMWEEYVSGDQPNNTRCYLEWRGAVRVRHSLPNPQLVFWDVWDFQGGVDGWLELATYKPVNPTANPPVADRANMTWQKVPVRQKGTSNYNWTRNTVNLADYFDFSDPNGETLIAFRFVFQTPSNNSVRRWYIDDVEVRSGTVKTFTLNTEWNLNDAAQRSDFITTGGKANDGTISGWGLVSNHKYGPSGMSWHESVGGGDPANEVAAGDYTPYKRHTEQPDSTNLKAVRVHALEINGWVDLVNLPPQDSRGNKGAPVLSFWHAYDVGSLTGLAVQYTTDDYSNPEPNWITFTDGNLRALTVTTPARNLTFLEQNISLDRAQLSGSPSRIRIRWAMFVHRNADRRDGWWIDQIRLGREEDPKWTDYPFNDDAQQFVYQYWRFTGDWAQSDLFGRPGIDEPPASSGYKRYSYISSPSGAYNPNQTTWLQLKWPIDFYNNTPNKLFVDRIEANQNGQNTYAAVAQNPQLSFYHRRDINLGDKLVVEWKQVDSNTWTPMWEYRHGMQTVGKTSTNSRTGTQLAWERVEVDLKPILTAIGAPDATNPRKDDIQFRFVLVSDAANQGAGVAIDDIRVAENTTPVFKFWPTDVNGSNLVNISGLGNGDGVTLVEEGDVSQSGRGWWEAYHRGGDWYAISYESRTGLLSFHDSGLNGQDYAPRWDWSVAYGNGGCCGDVDLMSSEFYTGVDTFNVLELNTIIDLRATDQLDMPQLRFWSRFHVGAKDYLRVQVSYEMATTDSAMRTRCNVGSTSTITQCYEQMIGWSEWRDTGLDNKTLWVRGDSTSTSNTRSLGWTQERVDLRSFAANIVNPSDKTKNTPGKRIRIRFVYDALDENANRDGWYIDNVTLRYGLPGPNEVTEIDNTPFDDRSASMRNWIPEGGWGLDPNFYIGTGGGPIALGLWNVKWWQCNGTSSNPNVSNPSCDAIGQAAGAGSSTRFAKGADIFLSNPNRPAPDKTQIVSNLTYDIGYGSPVAGWATDRLMMEATIDTPVVSTTGFAPGPRSFTTLTDDGVRVKVEAYDSSGNIVPSGWILNNWTNHPPTTDMASFNFELGKRYRITVQYFENTGGAVMIFTLTDGRYSFADTPKQGSLMPDAMPIPFSNTSLVLNNILNLQGIENNEYIIMEYQTRYRIDGTARVHVEVSDDGGFTWKKNGLKDAVVIGGVTVLPADFFEWYDYNGYYGVNPADYSRPWEVRQSNLTAYRGKNIILRFRADFRGAKTSGPLFCVRRDDCKANNRLSEEFNPGYYDGWWITAIRVAKFGG